MVRRALVLAAGLGSRMGGDVPKPLISIGGEPSLLRLIRQFHEAGISDIAVVVGYRGDEIVSFTESRLGRGAVSWFFNEQWNLPNGLSVLAAKSFIDQPVLMTMSDHLFLGDVFSPLLNTDISADSSYLLVDRDLDSIFDMDDATKVLTDDAGRILDIGKNISSYNAIDTGAFVVTPALTEELSRIDRPSISDGVKALASRGRMFTVDIINGTWQDMDTPEALAHARQLLAKWSSSS